MTRLGFTNRRLRKKKTGPFEPREGQLHRLEATRRVLVSTAAIHAISWLWPGDVRFFVDDRSDGARRTKKPFTAGTRLALTLPILRRRL